MVLFISLFVSMQFVTTTYAQQASYPISQLGNCRDTKECFYYCEIPRNIPACWSYGKYVIEKNVLGTSTASPDEIAREHGITFPIPELGNCTSAQACMQYCNASQNQSACTDFGKKKGLIQDNNNSGSVREEKILSDAKSQLGCDSKDSCRQYCSNSDNQQKCQQFAQSEGLNQSQESSQQNASSSLLLQAAKQELGCNSKESCMNYCSNPDNQQKCQAFAQTHNLTPAHNEQKQQLQQSYPSGTSGIMPPCNSQDSCMKWCKDNPDKCKSMQQYNQHQQDNQNTQQAVSPYPPYQDHQSNTNQQQYGNNQQIPCSTDQECFQYCQMHPNACPGFQQNNSGYPSNGYNGQNQQPGTPPQNNTPSITLQSPPQQQAPPTSQPPSGSPSQQIQSQQSIPNNTADQQKMCNQTAGCNWTGSTCTCSSGH